MTAQPKPSGRMTVDEFLAWGVDRPGHHELADGEVVAMSPKRVWHAAVKFAVQSALSAAIRYRRLPCHMLPDGMLVRVSATSAFIPDALVYCGPRADADAVEIPNPVIVVEVLSPSTRAVDSGLKLPGYFSLDSVAHYLMVDPTRRLVVRHSRGPDGAIATIIATDGALDLTSPGLSLPVTELFADLPPVEP